MINPNAYFTVQAWMVNDLGLQDKELLVYAIIYGFSQDGNSVFSGSARYLADWIGCSRPTVMKVLKSLTEKKLLIKRDVSQNGVVFCTYRAVLGCAESLQGVKKFDTPCKEIDAEGVKKFDTPCKESLQNNDSYKESNNYRDREREGAAAPPAPSSEKEKEKVVKHKYGEYRNVLLADEELAKLQQQFPLDLPARIERLSEYVASTGKKYKSHYATIRAWASRDGKQQPARPARRGGYGAPAAQLGPNGIPIDPTKNDLDGIF